MKINRIYLIVGLSLSCLFSGCQKEPITSVEGTYRLGFSATADGWELYLGPNGKGTIKHRTDWEYDPQGTYNESSCGSFSYSVSGDAITFNNCYLSFNFSSDKSTVKMTLKTGQIEWGYTQGKKKYHNSIYISCDVLWNGRSTTNWNNNSAFQCDSNGNIYYPS